MIFLRVTSLALLLLGLVAIVQGYSDSPIPTGIYPEFRKDSDRVYYMTEPIRLIHSGIMIANIASD